VFIFLGMLSLMRISSSFPHFILMPVLVFDQKFSCYPLIFWILLGISIIGLSLD
jgi:hypothetical protein